MINKEKFLRKSKFTVDSVISFLGLSVDEWLQESYEELHDLDNDEIYEIIETSLGEYFNELNIEYNYPEFAYFVEDNWENITYGILDFITDF